MSKSLKKSQWEVYIIESAAGNFYTGITTDLDRRFSEHSNHEKGARFFHFSKPKNIAYRESYPNRSEASRRESEIKKMTRIQKLELIRRTQDQDTRDLQKSDFEENQYEPR